MLRMRVINQPNKSAGNKSGVYAVLGHTQRSQHGVLRGLKGQEE